MEWIEEVEDTGECVSKNTSELDERGVEGVDMALRVCKLLGIREDEEASL